MKKIVINILVLAIIIPIGFGIALVGGKVGYEIAKPIAVWLIDLSGIITNQASPDNFWLYFILSIHFCSNISEVR